jgi:hypothetical protein
MGGVGIPKFEMKAIWVQSEKETCRHFLFDLLVMSRHLNLYVS